MNILEEIQNEGRSTEEFGKGFLAFLREEFHTELQKRDSRLPWLLQIIDLFETALQNTRFFEIPPLAFEIAIAKALLLQDEFQKSLNAVESIPVSSTPDRAVKPTVKKEPVSSPVPKKEPIAPKTVKKVSQHDDTDLFPPADENAPWEEESTPSVPVAKLASPATGKPEEQLDMFSKIQAHWTDLCGLLPSSIKLILLQSGSCQSVEDNTVTIQVKAAASLTLLQKEKNVQKIQEVFSEKLEHKLTILFVGGEAAQALEVEDVESMLQF